ncbi:MAG: hypothetical protein ACRCZ9_07075 [Fusobacteriaceae bacterium]
MLLNLPNSYKIKFEPGIDYTYSSGKNNLRKVLTESSKGYCMYCYTKILINKKNFGHLEHTIEQEHFEELENCHYNISIACPKCNQSFKKKEQSKRKIKNSGNFKCDQNCESQPCIYFFQVADEYLKNIKDSNLEFIILKPRGILKGPNRDGNIYYEIDFDLLTQKFIPRDNSRYTENTKKDIQEHINKFHLNSPEYSTEEIRYVIEDILEFGKLPNKKRYNNYIAELFIDYLDNVTGKYLNPEEKKNKIIKICKIILSQGIIKHRF